MELKEPHRRGEGRIMGVRGLEDTRKNQLSRARRGSQKLKQQSENLEYFLKTKSHISQAGHELVSHPMVDLNFF